MAQAMSDRESSQRESVSGASFSRVSLTLATGYQQQLSQDERERSEVAEDGEKSVGRGSEAKESEGRKKEEQEMDVPVVAEPKPWNGVSGKSPSHASCEDGVQYLLENVPCVKEEFEVLSKIGEGTFSSVYLAGLKGRVEVQFALKHLVPTSASSRIENELKCLHSMGGRDNVIPLLTCVRHRDHVVLIMPYFPHSRFTDYLYMMTPLEVKCYMRALFTALRNVHSHHVIHRDIKPSNFLYNRDTGRFQLVDFGLAHLEPARAAGTTSDPSFSLSCQTSTAHSKARSRASCTAQPSLSTPPTSSTAQVTKAPITTSTSTRSHPQVHVNGTSLVPPSQTYRRHIHGRIQTQSGLINQREGEKERGRGEPMAGRPGRKVVEKKKTEQSNKESGVCPQRHKKTELCDVCQSRSHQNAPRAGTPGFRAPEVLLKCPHQTTAVDVWSAGVIFLCLLSGRYPFFRATDDLSALAQVVALMGTAECTRVARELGKELVCGEQIEAVDLRELCRTLRRMLHTHLQQHHKSQLTVPQEKHSTTETPPSKKNRLSGSGACTVTACRYELRSPQRRKSPAQTLSRPNLKGAADSRSTSVNSSVNGCGSISVHELVKSWESLPESAYDLLYKCLELNPSKRITAQDALEHSFLANVVR